MLANLWSSHIYVFSIRPKAKVRCQKLLLEYSPCLIFWSGAKTAVPFYSNCCRQNETPKVTSWTETSWQCYPSSKVSAKQLHLHFIHFSSENHSLSCGMFLIIGFSKCIACVTGVRKGRRRELGREAARKGEGRTGTPSSFLLPRVPFTLLVRPQIPFPFLFERLSSVIYYWTDPRQHGIYLFCTMIRKVLRPTNTPASYRLTVRGFVLV